MLIAVLDIIDKDCRVHRLPWAVDGAISIDTHLLHLILIGEVTEQVSRVHLWTGLVVIRIGKDLTAPSVLVVKDIFTLCIGLTRKGFVFVVADILSDAKVRTGKRLARRCTDHYIARPVARLRLCHRIDIGDEVQLADHFRRGISGELKHIDAYWQAFERQGILEELVRLLAEEHAFLLGDDRTQQGLYDLIALLGVRPLTDVAISFHAIDVHLQ